jgi:hypothetical protein
VKKTFTSFSGETFPPFIEAADVAPLDGPKHRSVDRQLLMVVTPPEIPQVEAGHSSDIFPAIYRSRRHALVFARGDIETRESARTGFKRVLLGSSPLANNLVDFRLARMASTSQIDHCFLVPVSLDVTAHVTKPSVWLSVFGHTGNGAERRAVRTPPFLQLPVHGFYRTPSVGR